MSKPCENTPKESRSGRGMRRRFLKWGVRVLAGLAVLATVAYGFDEPRSGIGHILFHLGYLLPPTRPQFLSFYQWTLKTGEGGFLPSSIDQFLTDRLWECEGTREFDAIVDFQIDQGSGRWGEAPSRANEELKEQIVETVIRRLDTMPDRRAVSAMLFVESLRRGTPLWKGGFSNLYTWDRDRRQWDLRREQFELAKRSFRNWWAQNSSWREKATSDPLAGTGLRIHEGP
jgi:hypothetical protein